MESTDIEETKGQKLRSKDELSISKILDAKVAPLFSLPSDLMSPKRRKKKEQELIKRKEKVQKSRETLYTAKRLREEKFRRFMVGLIVKPELPAKDVDLSDDKDINRYYYYICNGVDTIHTASIEEELVRAILVLVPENLRDQFPDFSNNLMTEIKEDFTRNIKRAIVDFALTDHTEEYLSKLDGIEGGELRDQPDLRKYMKQCREILRLDLYLINPCMRMTLEQWIRDYRYRATCDLTPRCACIPRFSEECQFLSANSDCSI
ncbi:dynein heavy chain 7, axonemal-like [Ooceraea biroi]|uniref:dynein heavy chain 7, axonemal-like n=1 Tax=Ooceraea biroi TaxID=2015173 RepID=UPI000971675E|nr:dynein heavy chain 7, axonemal-like [Ooceraea biroi]